VSPVLAAPLFIASLAVTLVAARLFARRLDRLGVRLGFPEAVIGLLTALAADGPEISAALFALVKQANSVGVGVIVGSNTFNIAAMIGVSGLLTGGIWISRRTLVLEGGAAVAITVIAMSVLFSWIPPAVSVVLAACVVVPYLLVVLRIPWSREAAVRGPRTAEEQAPLRAPATRSDPASRSSPDPTHHLLGLIVLDVTLIVLASAAMVQAAIALGDDLEISRALLGTLILAPLTSVPNAITGIRLGLARRSTALVAELFNSNTINLGAGVIVPALFVTLGTLTVAGKVQVAWLMGMTALTVLLLARRRGIGRAEACCLIALYGGFVASTLAQT
jgi:cation:H+ antiporter